MKKILWVSLLVFALILSWSMVSGMELVGDAPVPKTGQTTSYCSGDDGDLEEGVPLPTPRFTDNGNGTVTDNLSGLIWMKKAHCIKFFWADTSGTNERSWVDAVPACYYVSNGYCGLSDGSSPGDWRLPNIRELVSLIHYGYHAPAISNAAGTGQYDTMGDPFDLTFFLGWRHYYWTSTTYVNDTNEALRVNFIKGRVAVDEKVMKHNVWCVGNGGHDQ